MIMQCTTIKGYQGNKAIFAPKKKFYTLEAAQCNADFINKGSKVFIKRAAYKCHVCGHFHVGKTNEMIPNKTPKRTYGLKIMKVVGHIDLSKLVKRVKGTIILETNDEWNYAFNFKIVKITTCSGRVRHIPLKKIYKSDELKLYAFGSKLSMGKLLDYLNKNVRALR